MTDFLIDIIDNTPKNTPIFLIDVSGSTSDKMGTKIVRDYEFDIALNCCKTNGYNNVHLICWSSEAILFENLTVEQFSKIKENQYEHIISSTELNCGLELLKESYFNPNNITDIFIITDGEICDNEQQLGKKLKEISEYKINLYIIAVENNYNNYLEDNCQVGNNLYNLIKKGCMTRMVNKFSIYNKCDREFINFANPSIPPNYVPFQNKMFEIHNMIKFIKYLYNTIMSGNNGALVEKEYIKFAYDLSLTCYHLIYSKTYKNQMDIIDILSNVFKETDYYTQIRKILLEEVNNHIIGKANTFTEMAHAKRQDFNIKSISVMNGITNNTFYNYSFLMRNYNETHYGKIYVVKSYNKLNHIYIGKNVYKNMGIEIKNNVLPILINPNDNNIQEGFHWLLLNYAHLLNFSPNNPHLLYYILIDALIVELNDNPQISGLKEIYNKYTNLKHNLLNYTDIPEMILIGIPKYINIKLLPLSLLYIIATKFLNITDTLQLQQYCEPHIRQDLVIDGEIKWDNVYDLLCDIIKVSSKICIIDYTPNDINIISSHKIPDTNIDCIEYVCDEIGKNECKFCGKNIEPCVVCKNENILNDFFDSRKRGFYNDITKFIQLDWLDGEKKNDELIVPTNYGLEYDYLELKDKMIVEPYCNVSMKVNNINEFNYQVKEKYPFITKLDMTNVVLCGGFVRSILLKQRMKDFDFFMYGLKDNEYNPRFYKLVNDLIANIREFNSELKFGMFYKPLYNVFEMICFEDPKNHINGDFTLDNFDKYEFTGLKKYCSTIEKDQYFFEDDDDKGIKMIYRFQFILCKYNNIFHILNSFDMFPSMVAYDGQVVYFTKKSLMAYRFMINEVCLDGGSDLFKSRLCKYFKYGFSIVLPKNNDKSTNKNDKGIKYKFDELIFNQIYENKNIVYVDYGTIDRNETERIIELEKQAQENKKALYISPLFCSFVSFLRYVKINEINYIFPQFDDKKTEIKFNDDSIVFKNNTIKFKFLDKLDVSYKNRIWYKKFIDSIKIQKIEKYNNCRI